MRRYILDKRLLIFSLLILMGIVLSAPVAAFPSKDRCKVGFKVYAAKSNKTLNKTKVFAIWNKENKAYKARLKKGFLLFPALREGSYDIFVAKKGYKQSSLSLTVGCEQEEKTKLQVFSIPLWKGKFDKTVSLIMKQQTNEWVIKNDAKSLNKVSEPSSSDFERGVINGRALRLAKPAYPDEARAIRARGRVAVKVTINEAGFIESARALAGHPALRREAVVAAKRSRFAPVKLKGKRIKVNGIIVFNFSP